jgi:hypothetical protein
MSLEDPAQNGHGIKRATGRASRFLCVWWHAAVPFALQLVPDSVANDTLE